MTRLLLVSCLAVSAGVHVALAAEHGISFHVAAALLAVAAATISLRPGRAAAAGAALLLAALLGAYALEHGLEAGGVAGATKVAEALGVVAAVRLALGGAPAPPERLATLAAAVSIAVFAAAVTPVAGHEHPAGVAPHGH